MAGRGNEKAVPAFIFVTVFVFTISYIFYPVRLLPLPVGWDTPRYVWHMRAFAEDWNFIEKMDFNNFVYALLGSLLVRLGVDAFLVEMLLPPILLSTLLVEAYFLLTRLKPNGDWKIYTLMSLSWFGAFRVAADLHANLLALNILLPSAHLLNGYLRKGKRFYLGLVFALLVLSSFIHIESTLFLTFIFLLAMLSEKGLHKIKRIAVAALILIAILPAAMLYYMHIKKLLIYSGGSFRGVVMDLWKWLLYLGPAGFVGVYQLIMEARFICKEDFLKRLFTIWGFISITSGLIQYLEPSFMIFSERAVILFPTPFLAIHKIGGVNYGTIREIKKSFRTMLKFGVPILVMVFNMSAVLLLDFYNITIHPEAYEKMLFLRQKFHNKPIIIIAEYMDRYAGELGQHIYDWGRAVIGNVYTYVGSVYYLRDWMPTPFFYWASRQASNILFQEIRSDFQSFDDVVIVYGLDFTEFTALPKDFEKFMEPLEDGLYIVNMTKFRETEGKLIIPIFQYSRVVYGNWYPSNESWGDYPLVFECWMTGDIAITPSIEVLFAVKEEGNYTISLSFWANETTSLQVQVDENQPRIFNGTGKPEKGMMFAGFLDEGEHLLKVSLLSRVAVNGKVLRARLNVLEVSKLP